MAQGLLKHHLYCLMLLDGSRPILVRQLPSGDSVGGQILNMFDMDSRLMIMDSQLMIPTGASVLESADLELELADSSADSNANPKRIGVWDEPLELISVKSTISYI